MDRNTDRFKVTRVNNEMHEDSLRKIRNEIAINVNDLNNMRRNSRTVPNFGEARKFSLAQLTRQVIFYYLTHR